MQLHSKKPGYWTDPYLTKIEVNRIKMTNSGYWGFFSFIHLSAIFFLYNFSVNWRGAWVCWTWGFPSPQQMGEVLFLVTPKPYRTLSHSKKSSGSHALHLSWAIFTLGTHYKYVDKYYGYSQFIPPPPNCYKWNKAIVHILINKNNSKTCWT